MSADAQQPPGFARFRVKLLVAMMLVVSAVLGPALFFSQRDASEAAQRERAQAFDAEINQLRALQEMRHAILAERCRQLARKPRIHAALEDNALDLLYPSARNELLDIMGTEAGPDPFTDALHARFYRFLDHAGAVIHPSNAAEVGALRPEEEAALALPGAPSRAQLGFLRRTSPEGDREILDEIIAMPIVSSETGEPIAALVLGFKPLDTGARRSQAGVKSGVWLDHKITIPDLSPAAAEELARLFDPRVSASNSSESISFGGEPWLLFHHRLNPESLYPAVHEVILYPLRDTNAAQQRRIWGYAGAWTALLLVALLASHLLASRLSQPVEKLAVDSELNRSERRRAEAALESTHEELMRSARFSADASHQLKTPVTVLRVGLEELLAGEKLTGEVREEVSSLVHQTFRLTSVIEDLLLLSRLDAGRLKLESTQVEFTRLMEAALDDLEAVPDSDSPEIEKDFPSSLPVEGEQRYLSLLLQNLLENARKYNRPGGRIRLHARIEEPWVLIHVGNTGPTISAEAQQHMFERFHRGALGENIPGHGLGLNLARELARLHGGDLRLMRSADDWTEFEIRLRLSPVPRVEISSSPA